MHSHNKYMNMAPPRPAMGPPVSLHSHMRPNLINFHAAHANMTKPCEDLKDCNKQKWDSINMETLKEVKRQSLKESFDSFMNHADDCNSCQFNIKTVVGLALGSQIDL